MRSSEGLLYFCFNLPEKLGQTESFGCFFFHLFWLIVRRNDSYPNEETGSGAKKYLYDPLSNRKWAEQINLGKTDRIWSPRST